MPLLLSSPLTKIGYNQLYSSSAGEKVFPTIPRSKGLAQLSLKICTKLLRNWSKTLSAKFPSTSVGYSVVRIFFLNDALLEILDLEASPEEGQQLLQKEEKEKRNDKPRDVGHLAFLFKN